MDIQVTGKNMELGDALRAHVGERLYDGVTKYFDRGGEAVVTFAKERRGVECEMTARLATGVMLATHGEAGDAYGAFDEALDKLEKRVRRYKRRLKNHHAGERAASSQTAAYYTLAPLEPENEDETALAADPVPVVVAESQTQLREMTVGAAVMQLDLAESPVIVFKNAAHGRLNIVYRRRDGHIGWIDPRPEDHG